MSENRHLALLTDSFLITNELNLLNLFGVDKQLGY
jgi:hypothetical protein